jgi:hypothetical protein
MDTTYPRVEKEERAVSPYQKKLAGNSPMLPLGGKRGIKASRNQKINAAAIVSL